MISLERSRWLPLIALALSTGMLWPATSAAERGFGISDKPDTLTHFVWLGARTRKETGLEMMLLLQNGMRRYEVNLSTAVDVHFSRSDAGRIKWCSYSINAQESPKASKKCIPAAALPPAGEISIP